MIRSKLLGTLVLTTAAMLALAGCRTTVVEHEQPVAQPAPQPDRHDARPDRRDDNNAQPDRRDNNARPDHQGPGHDNGGN